MLLFVPKHLAQTGFQIGSWKNLQQFYQILSPSLLNSSYLEQKLPNAWKQANIIPIPKDKPIRDINKNLRPMSLTPALSKLAEDIVIEKYVSHQQLLPSSVLFIHVLKRLTELALPSVFSCLITAKPLTWLITTSWFTKSGSSQFLYLLSIGLSTFLHPGNNELNSPGTVSRNGEKFLPVFLKGQS